MDTTNSLKFETSVLRVATIIGTVRMVIAIARDLTVDFHPVDFLLDVSLFLIVLIPLILTYTRISLKYYLIPFCFLIIIAIPFSWISSGGLDSNNEYQMIGAIFIFALVLTGRWLIFFSSLIVLEEILLIYVWNKHYVLIEGLTKDPSMQRIHFILMAVASTVALVYLKHMLCSKRKQLNEQGSVLSRKLEELADQTNHMVAQKEELEKINKKLERKVEQRSAELQEQNKSLSQYIDLSLGEINEPLHSIMDSITEITESHQDYELVRLLENSGAELQQSVKQVAENIEKDVVKLNQDKT